MKDSTALYLAIEAVIETRKEANQRNTIEVLEYLFKRLETAKFCEKKEAEKTNGKEV